MLILSVRAFKTRPVSRIYAPSRAVEVMPLDRARQTATSVDRIQLGPICARPSHPPPSAGALASRRPCGSRRCLGPRHDDRRFGLRFRGRILVESVGVGLSWETLYSPSPSPPCRLSMASRRPWARRVPLNLAPSHVPRSSRPQPLCCCLHRVIHDL